MAGGECLRAGRLSRSPINRSLMHEISLVRNIFQSIEAEYPELDPETVRGIYLQVGELSNVAPLALKSAFDAVLENDGRYQNATLHIKVSPIRIYCESCRKTSGIKNYHFICPCGKPSKNIVQGDELLITRITFSE